MLFSTSAPPVLPACFTGNDSPPPANPDAGRDTDNALSFASQLDQRLSRPEPPKTARRPDAQPEPQETNANNDASNAASASASATETVSRSTDTETSGEDSGKSDDSAKSKDKADTAASQPTPAVPLTPDALHSPAFLAALAAAPTVVPTPATAPTVTGSLAPVTPPVNGAVAAPTNSTTATATAPNAANASNAALVTAAASPIIPTVAMDSRAALNATPGVDNASPSSSKLPSVANPNLAAQNLLGVSGAPASNNARTPNTAALAAQTTGTTVQAAVTLAQTAATLAPNNPAEIAPDNLGKADTGIATPIATPLSATTTAIAPVAAKGNAPVPFPTAAAVTSAAGGTQASSPSEQGNALTVSAGKQNLGGIERALTLDNAKSAAPVVETPAGTEDTKPASSSAVAQGASLSPQSSVAKTVIAPKSGVYPLANATPAGSPASASTTGVAQTPATVTLPSAIDSAGKTGTIAPLPHGLLNAPELSRSASSPTSNNVGGIAGGGANGLPALTQAATLAGSGSGEQGQADAQPFSEEQGSASETRTANPDGVVSSSAFVAAPVTDVTPAAQTTSTVNTSSIDRAHVVEQVTRHIETMRLTSGGGEMRLRLNPQNLGSVQVTIAAHQDGVVARIAVESAQVQQVMEGAKEHLRAGLEARGLRVQSVEVTVTPNAISDNGAAFSGQRNWQSAGTQDGAPWQPAYSRPAAPRMEAASIASPSAIAPRAALPDSRLDCRA